MMIGIVNMKRRNLFILAPIVLVAVIAVSGLAISGTTYTWEKTFEVTKPEVECDIKIGECRVVGCPVKVWVTLKVDGDCRECCWPECKDLRNDCEGWEQWTCCRLNGTYSVALHWWNETAEDWHHVMYLQEEANVTLGCWRHVWKYMFVPELEGEYKVVVTFATDTETDTFSS